MSVSGHITAMTVGGAKVTAAYFNGQLVFQEAAGEDKYVTLTGNQVMTVSMPRKYWDGTMEYSLDGTNWETWDCSAITSTSSCKIMFRGTGNTYVTGYNAPSFYNGFVVNGTDNTTFEFTVSGDLMNMLDYQKVASGTAITTTQYCFCYLFYKQNIVSCSDLTMTAVPDYGYFNMFASCTKLATAPAMAAQTVGADGMCNMFNGCTALTETPEMLFTQVDRYGCNGMFKECTALTKIHITTETINISMYAFKDMFYGCTALVDASFDWHIGGMTFSSSTYNKKLNYGFNNLFYGCTSLTNTPNFYVHDGDPNSLFHSAFMNCSALTTAGSITMTNPSGANYMFYMMFVYCKLLTTPPTLTNVAFGYQYQCYQMFYYCNSLKTVYSLNKLGGSQSSIASNAFSYMYYSTGVTVGPMASYKYTYQIVVATCTTSANIVSYTTRGTTPISDANTKYGTDATIIMVN